jgi:hypothetical protein
MSGASPIIPPATVPPSIAGIPQPVFESGSATVPATPIPITGSPIIPPPTIGDPVGFPVFPPVDPDTAPVPVPVGPLVGPAVGPAPVPPSLPGVQQPQFVPPGSATVPASLFPEFTTTPPSPPIVFANVFNMGAVPPPSTPGQTPPPIIPSPVATIPQLPWPPVTTPPAPPLPVNTVRPTVTGTAQVGEVLTADPGTWTNATSEAVDWTRNGSPIPGATSETYTLEPVDVGALIGVNATATGPGGEASMDSLPVGPVEDVPLTAPVNTTPPLCSLNPTYLLCTGGNWTPNPPTYTLSYQWFADGAAVSGATGSTWTFTGHEGETAYCAVTAHNAAGASTPTDTNTVTIPEAAQEDDPEPAAARAAPVRRAKSKRKR